ncbi:oocyte zinc finger protein XlCOF7.1-like [Ranitomeya imitator]|uniref:oocyte zinc finger protein XlCOF7.1-like n=1 Tax=Ranitomeya imitator TaxID=111125 RepID=UPI0037E79840
MDEDENNISRRIIDFTLEIISVLSGEDYTIEKTSGDCVTPIIHLHVSGRGSRSESPITEAPHSPTPEKKILDLTNEITELLTGEVPVRSQDAAVYFSMEEWEYMEGQKDQYQDVWLKNDATRNDKDKSNMTARILLLALEIIDLLKGKEHTVVKKTSGDRVTPCMSGGRSKIQSPITEPLHSPTPEKKVLELANKITELLTREVLLRCQNVALYVSMEEWDYVEGHWDQYKDVVVEEHRPLVSPENGSDPYGGNVMLSQQYHIKNEDFLCHSSRENLNTLSIH